MQNQSVWVDYKELRTKQTRSIHECRWYSLYSLLHFGRHASM